MEFPDYILRAVALAVDEPEAATNVADSVRESLDYFAQMLPGRSVEVRVPPYRVVQILGGSTHRRGTPPAVVEMSAETWLNLVLGKVSWQSAQESGLILASGTGSDLSQYFQA